MNHKIIVGVGNIYANESLFASKINPKRKACDVTLDEYNTLMKNIKSILKVAIKNGGTTLKDFRDTSGKPGYFAQKLQVYGKGGENCPNCDSELTEEVIGQRNTVFCDECQI